jgi:hypothetical protein
MGGRGHGSHCYVFLIDIFLSITMFFTAKDFINNKPGENVCSCFLLDAAFTHNYASLFFFPITGCRTLRILFSLFTRNQAGCMLGTMKHAVVYDRLIKNYYGH